MEVVYPRCASIDVHKETAVTEVLLHEAGKVQKEIRTFRTMTDDLLGLNDWLLANGITIVAMESTGVYWKPIYNLLEGNFEVLLVNAAHIKAVPGRKTDVKDCEWLADLLAHGLLKGSFIPPQDIRDLRDLTRYRKSLMDERVREINRLQKILESANIKLSSVATDVMGVSGRAMLAALIAGDTTPEALADLAKGRLRKKLPLLRQALKGRFRPHHQSMLEMILSHLDYLDELIERLSQEVEQQIAPFFQEIQLLDTIPGVDLKVAEAIIAEIGMDMSRFPSDRHLASWAGLCPGNNESAGKRKNGKTRKGDRWLKRSLIEASLAASRTKDTYLGVLFHRVARRRGVKKAVIAVAHAILVIAYHILAEKLPYREFGANYFDRLNEAYIKHSIIERLESLGYRVILEPLAVPVA
jgi:transposase